MSCVCKITEFVDDECKCIDGYRYNSEIVVCEKIPCHYSCCDLCLGEN